MIALQLIFGFFIIVLTFITILGLLGMVNVVVNDSWFGPLTWWGHIVVYLLNFIACCFLVNLCAAYIMSHPCDPIDESVKGCLIAEEKIGE